MWFMSDLSNHGCSILNSHLFIWLAILNVYEHFITALCINHNMVDMAANRVRGCPTTQIKMSATQYLNPSQLNKSEKREITGSILLRI